MNELASGLLSAIVELFTKRYEASTTIKTLEKRLNAGTASLEDAERYAEAVSGLLNRAYSEVLKAEDLPEGNIYWETCKAIIEKPLTDVYNKAAKATAKALDAENAKNGIGLKAQAGEIDADRLAGVVSVANKAETFDDAAKAIAEPVKSVTRSAVVDAVHATADFQDAAGLEVKIIRTTRGKNPCAWCRAQAGVYDYESVKKTGHNVWRRHERCTCKIEYVSKKTRYTVDNYRRARDTGADKVAARKRIKADADSTPEKIAARKALAGVDTTRKAEYNKRVESIHREIKENYSKELRTGMQNKHIKGTSNYDPTRSELTANPKELFKLYSGKGDIKFTKSGAWNQKEFFTHTEIIGVWIDKNTGESAETNRGTIHYSQSKGWHIVPARPEKEVKQ